MKNIEKISVNEPEDVCLYVLHNRENLDAAWLFNKELNDLLPVKGDHIIFMISEELAIITGSEDNTAMHVAISIQLREWQKQDINYPPFPIILKKSGITTWEVPQSCLLLSLLKLEQDLHLENLYRKHNKRLHRLSCFGGNISSFKYTIKADSTIHSSTTIQLSQTNIIPKVDHYTVVKQVGTQIYKVASGNRKTIFDTFGSQFIQLFEYPDRYEYDGQFTFEQLQEIGVEEPTFSFRPSCPLDSSIMSNDPYLVKLATRLEHKAREVS